MDKEKIIKMLENGKTYQEISDELQISKWTLIYHFSPNRKKSMSQAYKNYRKRNPLVTKMSDFYRGNPKSKTRPKIIRFTLKDLLNKIGPVPKCYLTGELIDLDKPEDYSLDHIIPTSRGGDSSLENCGLTSNKANRIKQDLLYDELILLCKQIVKQSESLK